MKNRLVHICRFEASEELTGRARTYKAVKAAVIRQGRFSVFEATQSRRDATLFTRLCQDPEVEIVQLAYPWTGVRQRQVPKEQYEGPLDLVDGITGIKQVPHD